MASFIDFLLQVLSLSAPLLLCVLGGYFSERSGVVNIALEGKMLTACFVTFAASHAFGAAMGLVIGIASSVLMSVLHWLMTQRFRVDQIISGMAINFLASGGTSFAKELATTDSVPAEKSLPLAVFYALAWLLPLAVAWHAKSTRGGLHLRASGSDPDKARLVGIQPLRVRFFALIGTGLATGLAGALILTETKNFTDNMTSGKGYIALAALILGSWRPVPAALACVLFGTVNAIQIRLKGVPIGGFEVPSALLSTLPYVVTLIALAGFLGRNRTPAGLGKL